MKTSLPRRRALRWAPLAAAALLAACGGDGGTPTPVPGELVLRLETPFTDDRAMVVSLSGPGAIASVAPARAGTSVYSTAPGGTTRRVAVFGAITGGDLLRLSVPDVNRARAYTATVVEAAGLSNQPRADVSGYRVTFAR
ncbi:MAG TPA: hypothetical protein VF746_03440 [Longimicrobium sp.]|jgi:hypothetical protein